jgi:type II secretory ATPase GspE/PulE/Tfp pilus assembly ATPase PilB-like protein
MVGEIRDRETADIAIRASLTGHLVMSTLHTNDAPGALTRLVDMDIEPFLIASSVEMIIAQRLVRRLCPNCAQPANYDEAQIAGFLATMRIDPSEAQHGHLAKSANGCERCRKLGFRGRVGMFEILRVTEEIHEHIVKRDSARLIRQTAISQDMRTLMQSGWAHVKAGTTTFEEAMRFAELESDEE